MQKLTTLKETTLHVWNKYGIYRLIFNMKSISCYTTHRQSLNLSAAWPFMVSAEPHLQCIKLFRKLAYSLPQVHKTT